MTEAHWTLAARQFAKARVRALVLRERATPMNTASATSEKRPTGGIGGRAFHGPRALPSRGGCTLNAQSYPLCSVRMPELQRPGVLTCACSRWAS